jgi:hypothetical protein
MPTILIDDTAAKTIATPLRAQLNLEFKKPANPTRLHIPQAKPIKLNNISNTKLKHINLKSTLKFFHLFFSNIRSAKVPNVIPEIEKNIAAADSA